MTLHFAAKANAANLLMHLYMTEDADLDAVMEKRPDKHMMRCKFKGTLTSAQMKEDLVFEASDDDTPYQEHRIVW